MEKFHTHRGKVAPLDRANVDTDQIIPKQFLKSIRKTGFGENLFYDWRYLADGNPDPEFTLNQEAFRGATLLIARNNFGCGSSREHAVWAVQQYGFRAVLAPSKQSDQLKIPAFADIFSNNCSKNGLLTVELTQQEVDQIFDAVNHQSGLEMTVDLPNQKVIVHASREICFNFEIDASAKKRFLEGLDDIALTLEASHQIQDFESRHHPQL